MDEEGFIFVVGRTKDIIKVGGERVSAKEIEEVLLQLNQVRETAVIGVEDEYLGEAIKAYIAVKSENSLTEDTVRNHCKKRLPPYKYPKFIEFIDDLPKNKSGKILKNILKELSQSKN